MRIGGCILLLDAQLSRSLAEAAPKALMERIEAPHLWVCLLDGLVLGDILRPERRREEAS